MATQIDEDATALLEVLAKAPRDTYVDGSQLQQSTGLDPSRINDAMAILVDSGLAEWLQVMGTAPFDFGDATITPRGRYEYQRAAQAANGTAKTPSATRESPATAVVTSVRPPSPVGSPYGFTDEDWEIVAERKARQGQLRVVLGYQFASEYYDTEQLKQNIKSTFESAVSEYNHRKLGPTVSLHFKPLAAGYGEHLFNDIARDIIGADIAVFEASDLNPNVMIEMGVALTWGVRVLPIKAAGRPKPPSDVSGHTWADYRDSALTFEDQDHQSRLVRMIQRAVRKKGKAAV
jgi:hypothetical protein